MRGRKTALVVLALGVSFSAATNALATTGNAAWKLSLTPMPTSFRPGTMGRAGEGNEAVPRYELTASNIGGAAATGPITISVTLPEGLILSPISEAVGDSSHEASLPAPSCIAKGQMITCTGEGPLYPGRQLGVTVPLGVVGAPGLLPPAEASVEGGGALASTTASAVISDEPPPFDFLSGSAGFASLLTGPDGGTPGQAGEHPDQLTVGVAFPSEQQNTSDSQVRADGHVRDVVSDLPQGVVANPNATLKRCTEAELVFNNGLNNEGQCLESTQVGVAEVTTELPGGATTAVNPVYNMVTPHGTAAELGFEAVPGVFVHITGGVRSDGNYALYAGGNDIVARANNPIFSVQLQLWGDPSAESHDEARQKCGETGGIIDFCPIPIEEQSGKPFLTMPSACSESITSLAHARSWEEAAEGVEELPHRAEAVNTEAQDVPINVRGCSSLEFEPTLTVQPESSAAETPTGVEATLEVPQNEGLEERATSTLKDVTVRFPTGMALNPAAASGLQACTPEEIGMKTKVGETPAHFSATPPNCPDASKIGTVEVTTPLLDHPLPGSVYVAQPYQNPFGTLLGVYVVIDSPQDGIFAKLPGRTEADPSTGRLTTTFTETPELPFSSFKVDLFGGPRAALRTPSTCGTFTTESVLTPWSGTVPVPDNDRFRVTQGANGGPCRSGEADMPSGPGFEAGTTTPLAADYSPFSGRLTRADGEQQLRNIDMTLPAGLTGKLAGVQTCSTAGLEAAAAKSGTEELAHPSCPAGSQIGEVLVGAGAGPSPYFTTGKIYLTGPYRGGPISAAVITPAVAGPFDLGTVVIRAVTKIDPATAVLHVQSEDAPHILQGIPLELRDVRVNLNREQFTLNPTNCNPKTISGAATSVLGIVAPLSQRFQIGGCRGLDYAPDLSLRLFGGTHRGAHPRLRAVLTAKPGEEANTARASVALPHSEFLENAHIRTVCTRVQFAAHQCPPGAIYGYATAITPLLDEPLEGPVYLRSSSHELPDMVAALHGPPSRPIEIELDGRIDSIHGGIRTTFETVPDQPVSKFIVNLKGAKKGLLVNSRDLCARTYKATARFDGQNGKVHDFSPPLKSSCGKSKQQGHHRHRRGG